jgi:hypothetical protein
MSFDDDDDDDAKPHGASIAVTTATTATVAPADQPTAVAPAQDVDVVVLGPPTADGAGVHVLRARPQGLETGELRNLQEGRPITGEIVTLAPRKDNPRICDVKESYALPKRTAGASASTSSSSPHTKKAKGPAQVATQAYRDNWDEVFARRTPGNVLN